MNIATMHIGMDVEMQQLSSEVFNKLQHEEKDYILNDVIVNLLKSALNKDDNTVTSIVSYQDIRQYYGILEPFLRTTQLDQDHTTGELFDAGILPADLNVAAFTSGILYADAKYKVLTIGVAADFSNVGGTSPPVLNDTFTCVISNLTTGPAGVTVGNKYRILDNGGSDYTTAGAADSDVGTVFIADAVGAGATGTVEVLGAGPTAWGGASMIPVYDTGYHNIIKIDALIECGAKISSGPLVKDKFYKVVTPGTLDLTSFGAYRAISAQNIVFTCIQSASPTWGATGTELIEVKKVTCRLIKMQDTGNFMDHSFGTTTTSPLAIIADNEVRVYHKNTFDIERIYIDYVRSPIEVNYTSSVDSDVRKSLHSFIVKLAARQALGISGAKEYQSLVMETEEDKKSITN